MKKFKLLSSLSTAIVTTSLITTSCATVVRTTNDTDIRNIAWIKRETYNSTSKEQIESIVKNDNVSMFSRYPGLYDAVTIEATLNNPQAGQVTISITTDPESAYIESTSWVASTGEEPLPIGSELIVNADAIERTLYVGSAAYTKKFEIFASMKSDSKIEAHDIANVDVTLTGGGITAATGTVETNRGYVNLTIGTTADTARLIITVTDTKNYVGSVEVVINVKSKWEDIAYTEFLTLENGISNGQYTYLKVNRDEKRIVGRLHLTGTFSANTDSDIGTFKSGYDTTAVIAQAGSIGGWGTDGSWWVNVSKLRFNISKAVTSFYAFIDYIYDIK